VAGAPSSSIVFRFPRKALLYRTICSPCPGCGNTWPPATLGIVTFVRLYKQPKVCAFVGQNKRIRNRAISFVAPAWAPGIAHDERVPVYPTSTWAWPPIISSPFFGFHIPLAGTLSKDAGTSNPKITGRLSTRGTALKHQGFELNVHIENLIFQSLVCCHVRRFRPILGNHIGPGAFLAYPIFGHGLDCITDIGSRILICGSFNVSCPPVEEERLISLKSTLSRFIRYSSRATPAFAVQLPRFP